MRQTKLPDNLYKNTAGDIIKAILDFLNNLWPYLVAVLIFILLIVIHEFGHFIAAKLMGVRVNEFAVGFGPKLLKKKFGETTYSVNLVPLGGYCAMEGEDEESADNRAFCNKKAWRRFIIVAAGALFNLLLGVILVAISLAPGQLFPTTTVAGFTEDSSSYATGLRENDKIIAVDGRRIFTTYDLNYAFTGIDDGKVDLTVKRNGEKIELQNVTFATESYEGVNFLQVDFSLWGVKKTFGNYIKQTAATTVSYGRVVWFSLVDLVTGKFGLNQVSGPVGITEVVGEAAAQNIFNIFPIMALITINLGIFNLLPIPALDGGRLIFILYEMIFRKKVPPKFEGVVHAVGFVILFGFMILVTFKDIWKLIAG